MRTSVPIDISIVPVERNGIVTGTIRDISPTGCQFTCDGASALALNPEGRSFLERPRPRVKAAFDLPLRSDSVKVGVLGELIYCRILPDDGLIVFGVRFLKYRDRARRQLEAFLAESLIPAEIA